MNADKIRMCAELVEHHLASGFHINIFGYPNGWVCIEKEVGPKRVFARIEEGSFSDLDELKAIAVLKMDEINAEFKASEQSKT